MKVAEPRVTLSSHSVSFSINRVNTEDDLGHGERERNESDRSLKRRGKETLGLARRNGKAFYF